MAYRFFTEDELDALRGGFVESPIISEEDYDNETYGTPLHVYNESVDNALKHEMDRDMSLFEKLKLKYRTNGNK